jgi:uncharacterized protein
MPPNVKPFRVLSLDGGGMRGLYSAVYLKALSDWFAKKHGKQDLDFGVHFQLIAGTSTGGILAFALAKGIPLSKVIKLYREHGPQIFPKKVPSAINADLLKQLWTRGGIVKQGNEALQSALTEAFGNETIGQLYKERKIALCIPAVNMYTHKSWVFKTPHIPFHRHRDDNTTIVDACLATSAAPIFRSLAEIPNNDAEGTTNIFCDGGLWANNPVLVGLTDALELTKKGDAIEIFCVSTSPKPPGEDAATKTLHRGLLEWQFGGKAAELSISAQEYAYDMIARKLAQHIDRDIKIFRFPREQVPQDQLKFLDLDETSKAGLEVLTRLASTDVDRAVTVMGENGEDGDLLRALLRDMAPSPATTTGTETSEAKEVV